MKRNCPPSCEYTPRQGHQDRSTQQLRVRESRHTRHHRIYSQGLGLWVSVCLCNFKDKTWHWPQLLWSNTKIWVQLDLGYPDISIIRPWSCSIYCLFSIKVLFKDKNKVVKYLFYFVYPFYMNDNLLQIE